MKYFTQIEAFFSRNMTGAEREAFEHEVVENADLAQELDAYQTGADLFDFAAGNLSDEQILDFGEQDVAPKTESKKPGFSYARLAIFLAVAAVVLLFALFGGSVQNQQEMPPVQPLEEIEEPAKNNIPIAESPLPKDTAGENEKLTAMVENQDPETINTPAGEIHKKNFKPSSSSATKASKPLNDLNSETSESDKLLSVTDSELISDALIDSGEEIVYQAGKQITLAPGFHAKAGSSFKAKVKTN